MAQVIIPAGQTTLPTVSDNDSILSQEGGQTLSGGTLDQSALATGITDFTIGPQSSISSTAAEPFRFDLTGAYRNLGAGGVIYIRPEGTNTSKWVEVIHSGHGTSHFVTGGKVETMRLNRGTVRVDAAVDVDNWFQNGGSVVQGFSSTANDGWTINAGTFNSERGLAGSGWIGPDATATIKRKNTNATNPTHTTGTITIAGRLNWQGGNMNALLGYGHGMLDLSGVTADITIASLTCTSDFRERSILKSANPGVTITFTSGPTIIDGIDEIDGKITMTRN